MKFYSVNGLQKKYSYRSDLKLSTFNSQLSTLRGFTLPELIIAMALFLGLAAIATISIVNVKQRTSLDTSVNIFIGDLKQQQLKSMAGDTEGRGTRENYSLHLSGNMYVLYHGDTYTENASGNFAVNLGDNVSFTTATDLTFQLRSGELSSGPVSIIVREGTTGEQRVITINKFGAITSVN